ATATWAILRTWLLSNRAETTPSVPICTPMMLPTPAPSEATLFTVEAVAYWVTLVRSRLSDWAAMPSALDQRGVVAAPEAASAIVGAAPAAPNRVDVARLIE